MKNIEKKDWYLGLDIGTNSVGWCATDTEYNILTKGSKLQCGARLFDDAVDASGRRAKRANRRRMARRKVRIDLLQELFAPIILPIDPNFFIRLNSSHLHCPDDITQNDKKDAKGNPIQEDQYSLFCDTANCGHRCPKGDNGVSLAGTRTKGFCDKVYYGKFPTIYHLKQHLLTNPESDPRLLYLACHHSIKYRGHFLNDRMDVDNIDVNAGFGEILYQINDAYARTMSTEVALFDTTKASQIPAIIQDKTKSIAKQFFDMGALINCPDADNRDKKLYQLLEFAKGGKLRFSKIWDTQEDKKQNKKDKEKTPLQEAESDQLKEWSFASEKYEDDLEYACNNELFDDMQKSVIDALKAMYDSILLSRIMVGHKYVSAAMVEAFERHKADLQLLKTFFKKYCTQEQYEEMFRHNSEFKDKGTVHASYANYVGSNLTSNKKSSSHFVMCISKGKEPMTASHEEFLKYVASVMEGVSEDAKESQEYKQIVQKIGTKIEADGNIKRDEKGKIEFDYSGDLCKIQVTKDNATIPHQLGLYELKNILTKQKNNFAFLAQEDFAHIDAKKPYTVQDKILKLITFRIPYYVGPLNEQNGGDKGFAWIVKNEGQEGQKVLPWNFEKVVNSAESGNQFIRRMTRACTYLASEPVVPKGSLLYQEYMLLQDLNNLKINGDRITQDIKEQLYSGICQKEKSLSKDKIKKWMIERGLITDKDKVGKEDEKDKNFNSALRSKIEFENILEAQFLASPQNCVIAEKIIEWHTVFTQDKKPVLERIQKEYGHIFDDRQIKELGKLNFAGWGRFSSKFLTGITAIYKETGETAQTILGVLQNTTFNLMEILNSNGFEPMFLDTVKQQNKKEDTLAFSYDNLVADLYCSPTVKRPIWQATLIAMELAKINGVAPKKVFVEVTRAEDQKKKGKMTTTRIDQVEKLVQAVLKDKHAEYAHLQTELNKYTQDKKQGEQKFRQDKLYLYFMQLGRCMYTGEPIDLHTLLHTQGDAYDIDHIHPQSLILDNSLGNRVLVTGKSNKDKGDRYPLSQETQSKMIGFWNLLKDKGLLTSNKFERLTSKQSLTGERIAGFINRQLVSTEQAVKETIGIFNQIFNDGDKDKNTKIVFAKAAHTSEFRHNYELLKSRSINNLHHAHDAYLGIVVGNVWDATFSKYWQDNSTFNEERALGKLFAYDRPGIWSTQNIAKIKKYMFDNKTYLDKFMVTKMPYTKRGEFWDQTIHMANKGNLPLKKELDTTKYGGYKTENTAYNMAIEYDQITVVKKATAAQRKKGIEDETKTERIVGVFGVPIWLDTMAKGDKDLIANKIFVRENLQDKNPKVLAAKIKMFSVLELDGVRYHMRSKDLQCSVTYEWYPDKATIQAIKNIEKYKKLIQDKQLKQTEEDKKTMQDIVFAVRTKNKNQKNELGITRENNLHLFDTLVTQIKKSLYAKYSIAKKIEEGKIERVKFERLPTIEQADTILQMMNFVTMNGVFAKMDNIGGVANETAKFIVGGKLSAKLQSAYVVNQSVTGLYESKIKLLDKTSSNNS